MIEQRSSGQVPVRALGLSWVLPYAWLCLGKRSRGCAEAGWAYRGRYHTRAWANVPVAVLRQAGPIGCYHARGCAEANVPVAVLRKDRSDGLLHQGRESYYYYYYYYSHYRCRCRCLCCLLLLAGCLLPACVAAACCCFCCCCCCYCMLLLLCCCCCYCLE